MSRPSSSHPLPSTVSRALISKERWELADDFDGVVARVNVGFADIPSSANRSSFSWSSCRVRSCRGSSHGSAALVPVGYCWLLVRSADASFALTLELLLLPLELYPSGTPCAPSKRPWRLRAPGRPLFRAAIDEDEMCGDFFSSALGPRDWEEDEDRERPFSTSPPRVPPPSVSLHSSQPSLSQASLFFSSASAFTGVDLLRSRSTMTTSTTPPAREAPPRRVGSQELPESSFKSSPASIPRGSGLRPS
mmetsp:Transcript_12752/g.36993  ORF Transcript_12752/g.36993 Transcript_12752/m.36993 type:complete len:249 (-) Transcript_12752:865-1611(-)